MPVVIFRPALANRIAGTILPGVTGLLADDALLVAVEFLAGALVTKDFLLIAIVLSLISILTSFTRSSIASCLPKCSGFPKNPVSLLFCRSISLAQFFDQG